MVLNVGDFCLLLVLVNQHSITIDVFQVQSCGFHGGENTSPTYPTGFLQFGQAKQDILNHRFPQRNSCVWLFFPQQQQKLPATIGIYNRTDVKISNFEGILKLQVIS